MNTEQILQLALKAAGLKEVPPDSGIIFPGQNIKKIMFGVDMEAAEMLIAKQLGVDLVITHHPKGGRPMVDFHNVMENQIQRMVTAGVPINKAQKALKERMDEVGRAHHVTNYDRAVSAAKVLNMPFMVIHSPADILAENTVQNHLDTRLGKKKDAVLKDVIKALNELPEYKKALATPVIRVGAETDYAGKHFVTMAGGTGGGKNVIKAYFEAGIGTLICMHMPDDVIKAVREQNIGNVIVAGHMASDSVGINKLITLLVAEGMEVFRMSGVIEP